MKKLLAIILALCMFFPWLHVAASRLRVRKLLAVRPSPLYRIPALPMRNPVKQN